jgi:hypothetical protein
VPTKEAKSYHKKKKVQPFTEQSTPVRTTGVPGDIKGHPINDKCTTMAGPRRTMEANAMNPIYFVTNAGRIATYDGDFTADNGFTLKLSTSDDDVHFASLDDLVDQTFFRTAEDLDRFFDGLDTRLASMDDEDEEETEGGKTARQKRQKGEARREDRLYYQQHKNKAKRRQKQLYKTKKNRTSFKRKQKLRRKNPSRYRRIRGGEDMSKDKLIQRVAASYEEKMQNNMDKFMSRARRDKRIVVSDHGLKAIEFQVEWAGTRYPLAVYSEIMGDREVTLSEGKGHRNRSVPVNFSLREVKRNPALVLPALSRLGEDVSHLPFYYKEKRVASQKEAAAPYYTWNQVRKDRRLRDRLLLPNNIHTEDQYYDWLAEQSEGHRYRSIGVPSSPERRNLRPNSRAPGRRHRLPDLDDVPF